MVDVDRRSPVGQRRASRVTRRVPLDPRLAAILLVAALARTTWVVVAAVPPPWLSDPSSYLFIGDALASGRGYIAFFSETPTAFFPPGYPFLLAVLFWLIERAPFDVEGYQAAAALNVVAGTATVALVFVVGTAAFGRRTGLVAAALTAVFPGLIFYTAAAHLETVFIFFSMAVLAVLAPVLGGGHPPARGRLLAAGALLGAAVMVRPLVVLLVPLVAVVGIVARWGWRRSITATAWLALPVVVFVVPWTVRNYVVMDELILMSTNAGDTLCIDRHPGATGDFGGAGACLEGFDDDMPPQRLEVERNRVNTRRSLEYVVEDPLRELRQIPTRLRFSVAHGHDGLELTRFSADEDGTALIGRAPLERVADSAFFVTLLLAVPGLVALVRGRRPERLLVLAMVVTLLSAPLGLYGYTRFWAPILPLQLLLAAHVVEALRRRITAGAG